jgi:transposase
MNAYPQPTIWEVPDEVWTLIEQVFHEVYPAQLMGQRWVHRRRVLHGMIFRRRTGCPWNHLPQPFGDDSPVHRHGQRGCDLGGVARLWAVRGQACEELGGVDWPWQAADAALGNARWGGDDGNHGTVAALWWKEESGDQSQLRGTARVGRSPKMIKYGAYQRLP